jgi:hypothetical protein
VHGPLGGYLFDPPSHSFRPVIGSPGGAYLGEAVLSGVEFGSAAPTAAHGIAVIDGLAVVVSRLSAGGSAVIPLDRDSDLVPDSVAWSRDGSVAVLYSRGDAWIQVVRGLPNNAAAEAVLRVPGAEALSSVAVDRDGGRIAIGSTGSSPAVHELANGTELVALPQLGRPSALTFGLGSNSLYVLDAQARRVAVLQGQSAAGEWPIEALEDPILIGVVRNAANQETVYVAGGRDRALAVYDPLAREPIALSRLPAAPSNLLRLSNSVLLLGMRTKDGEPLWSVSGREDPKVRFIPALPQHAGGTSQ